MSAVFLYGTLRHLPLLEAVLGRAAPPLHPARLSGHAVHLPEGREFPTILRRNGAWAEGALLDGLDAGDMARLEFYEGAFGYSLRPVRVTLGGEARAVAASAWFPDGDGPTAGAPFALGDWAARWGDIATIAAREAMTLQGKVAAADMAPMLEMMRQRAASRLRAGAEPGPATLRRGDGPQDLRMHDRRRPYTGFFAVEEAEFTHPLFGGGHSPVLRRAGFVMGDAVTVLPYDAARDRVLVVEQFRFGPLVRGDSRLWSLEPVAGRIDPGETPQEAARREAREEAGLELDRLEQVARYYPSPGAVSEYLFSFVAPCDLPDGAGGLGGAADENEDIRAHVIAFDRLMALIASGEVDNGPLILTALWMQRKRAQGAASG